MAQEEISLSDKEAITILKSELKFKTHYGMKGETDINATNVSANTLDLSDLLLHIEQDESKKYKTRTLQEMRVVEKLDSNTDLDIRLPLDEVIENDFSGKVGRYNVSIVYKSEVPLENSDERNIYYIAYKYKGK